MGQEDAMEAAGSLGFPIPRPVLQKHRPGPRVAQGFLEIVLVELTRPAGEAFTVRIFEEGYRPSEADLVATFVLYGAEVRNVGRRLESAWATLGLSASSCVRYVCYRSYDHSRSFGAVLQT